MPFPGMTFWFFIIAVGEKSFCLAHDLRSVDLTKIKKSFRPLPPTLDRGIPRQGCPIVVNRALINKFIKNSFEGMVTPGHSPLDSSKLLFLITYELLWVCEAIGHRLTSIASNSHAGKRPGARNMTISSHVANNVFSYYYVFVCRAPGHFRN